MRRKIKNTKSRNREKQYNDMMKNLPAYAGQFSSWEKVGDLYKKFSIYDYSIYETQLSTNIP